MKKQYLIALLAICFLPTVASAQKSLIKKADKKYDRYAYVDAQEMYQELIDNGYATADTYKNLGDSYYFSAQPEKAVESYEKLINEFGSDESVTPEYYLRYALSLKTLKQYELADTMMRTFREKKGDDSRAQIFSEQTNYLEEIAKQFGKYKIESLKFNSGNQDFGPAFYGDGLVFSSNRVGDPLNALKHKWNGQPFLDLYTATNVASINPRVSSFNKVEANTKYHESTSVFNKEETTMFFTRNNYIDNKTRKDDEDVIRLRVFRSDLKDGVWTEPVSLPFNSDDYSVAHPALSPDGNTLYFASDMPGTLGGADIWKVAITGENTYGEPVNLGDKVNTEGRESFPFVSATNNLYYATDGIPGLGGLDVFATSLDSDGLPTSMPYNLGEPVNSPYDDFSFIIKEDIGQGFFASNREGGFGYDDIYGVLDTGTTVVQQDEAVVGPCLQSIGGQVTDEKTGAPIANASVVLLDGDGNQIYNQIADANGRYRFFQTACNNLYLVRGTKTGYSIAEQSLSAGDTNGMSFDVDLRIKKELAFQVGDDLAEKLDLNPIYFDFDKSNIRYDASLELAKVLAVMNQVPSMKIDVRSHTDSRGRDAYNLALSKRRNKSTIQWLIDKGIDASRLTGDGYGETRLKNRCANGVSCSEEEHQLNRRSEFIIVSQ